MLGVRLAFTITSLLSKYKSQKDVKPRQILRAVR